VGDRLADKPRGRFEGVAEEDAFSRFDGELGTLRGVDVNVGGAAEDAEIREVTVASVKDRVGDVVGSLGP
jgi:hypothetical protein